MKAYRLANFTGLDDLRLRDEDEPPPQRGEPVVRVRATSLNFRDIAMVRDKYPLPRKKGLIPASDAAGEVAEVGEGVDTFKVGDRVMSTFHPRWYGGWIPPDAFKYGCGSEIDGWLAERKVISQEAVVRVPDRLSDEEASTLPCAGLSRCPRDCDDFERSKGRAAALARGGRGRQLQGRTPMGRARACLDGRARRGPRGKSRWTGDDGTVPACGGAGRRNRFHWFPGRGGPRH